MTFSRLSSKVSLSSALLRANQLLQNKPIQPKGNDMADAKLDLNLDVYQGYNFKKSEQSSCGFVTKMKIGDKEITADQSVKNIVDPEKELLVVGVLGNVLWHTGVTDPILLDMQISLTNKQNIKLLMLKEMVKIDVTFQFICFEFDCDKNQFFPAFHANDTDLAGIVHKDQGKLMLAVNDDPSTTVKQPQNFRMVLKIEPTKEQTLHVATSVPGKIGKQWGMNVKA